MFTLTFSVEEIKIIDKSLMQMPYGYVALLIQNINNQLKQQQEQLSKQEKETPHEDD